MCQFAIAFYSNLELQEKYNPQVEEGTINSV